MLILGDRMFIDAVFNSEAELEQVVVDNSERLFGPSTIYLPKALISTRDGSGTIPDGFVIDLANKRWFLVEAELATHSIWTHIAPQVQKQLIAAMNHQTRQALVELTIKKAQEDSTVMDKFSDEEINQIDISRYLAGILETPPIIAIPIDAVSSDLEDWARHSVKTDVKLWIVRKFVEFGNPDQILYQLPDEFRPALDTTEEEVVVASQAARSRYDVGLPDLIERGILEANQKLFMQWKPRDGERRVFEGLVKASGEIEINGKSFKSPSDAAVSAMQSAGSSRLTENGWTKWKTGSGETLSILRDKYIQVLEKS